MYSVLNIYTSTYQKTLLHTLLLLVFKIVENLQSILKNPFAVFDEYTLKIEADIALPQAFGQISKKARIST